MNCSPGRVLHRGLKGEGAGVGNEGESLRSSDEIMESSQDDGDRVRICMQAVTVVLDGSQGSGKKFCFLPNFRIHTDRSCSPTE